VAHLVLGRVAVADHGLLYLQRRVLGHGQAGDDGSADRRAAGLSQRQRRLGIGVDEDLFDGDLDRRVRGDHLVQPLEDGLQPHREIAGTGLDAAARHVHEPVVDRIDDAEPGHLQARIDAEDSQSITAVV